MKFIIGNTEDLLKLVGWYNKGEVSADEYFDAVDAWATIMVRKELEAERQRRDNR